MTKRRDFLKQTGLGAATLVLRSEICAGSEGAPSARGSVAPLPSFLAGYESLYREDPRAATLAWFRKNRFGMMVCYSLCSLDGVHCFEQWQNKIPVRDYEKKAERFKASGFSAGTIADLAQQCGMKYVTMIAKFCEGFCLWNTRQTPFNTVQTAAGRDLIGEMAEACRKRGLGFFPFYEHGIEWHHPNGPRFADWKVRLAEVPYPTPEPTYAYGDQYDFNKYVDFVYEQITEQFTQYGPLAGIKLDGWQVPYSGDSRRFRLPQLYAQIRRLQPHALIAYKWGITGTEDIVAPEIHWIIQSLQQLGDTVDRTKSLPRLDQAKRAGKPLQVTDTLLPGWLFQKGVKPQGPEYALSHLKLARKTAANYLLSIALLPDGSINPQEAQTLRAIAEAIRRDNLLDY